MTDYERIARAIEFIVQRADSQPTLAQVAAHVHLSPGHLQRVFSRWAGVSPKRFLQALTVERAKQLLDESRSVLEVSAAVGLSSGSRLFEHFVQLEAATPGEFKRGGKGVAIDHAVGCSPFGNAFIAATARGICSLEFLDDDDPGAALARLRKQWPHATLTENPRQLAPLLDAVFSAGGTRHGPLSLHVAGTNFQLAVWKALLRIPPGRAVSYAQIASHLGRPRAARAVGRAVGDNPVAFLIPCHRVIRLSGTIGGYHWGETRKHALHAWEAARHG